MKRWKKAAKKGFTLAEMLIVVAILAILTAVAAPNVAKYSKGIKLRELDDSARAIYMAAQHEFKSKIAMGEKLIPDDELDTPARYTSGGSVSSVNKIYYTIYKGSAASTGIVSTSAIEPQLAENNFVIEFNAETGDVYGVFYSVDPNEFDDYKEKYNDNSGKYAAAVNNTGDRVSTLGYYGLENVSVSAPPKPEEIPEPEVRVFNAEKLVLEVTNPVGNPDAYISLKVNDIYIVPRDGKAFITAPNSATFILDSLGGNTDNISMNNLTGVVYEKTFSAWASGITPGSDLNIEVTFYDNTGVGIDKTKTVKVNSLFADGSSPDYAHIEYGRHLQNLEHCSTVQTVSIDKTVDFKKHGSGENYDSWNDLYGYDTTKFHAVSTAATNISAKSGVQIRYLNADRGGIFHSLNGASVNGIEVVNPKVTGDISGAIASMANAGSFTNCSVYIESGEGESWENPASDPYSTYKIECGDSYICFAGGLSGMAINNHFTNCISAVKVKGHTAGGLIGLGGGNNIENCAVLGHTYEGKFEGKISEDKDFDLKDNISGENAGGLIGHIESKSLNLSGSTFSTCSVKGTNANPICPNLNAEDITVVGDNVYTLGTVYGADGSETTVTLPENVKSADEITSAPNSYGNRYDSRVSPAYKYPVPGGMTLHGDWPSSEGVSGFFYWEKEEKIYKIYALVGGSEVKSSLCNDRDGKIVSEYGYGAFSSSNVGEVGFSDENVKKLEDEDLRGYVKSALESGGISANNVVLYTGGSGIVTATVSGSKYQFAPEFYALYTEKTDAAEPEKTVVTGTDKGVYGVRCKEHLENVGKYLKNESVKFVQSHDITPGKIKPIGSSGSPFKGSYDGGSYRIIDAQIIAEDGDYAGLFSATDGATLENIVLFHRAGLSSDFAALTVKESDLSKVKNLNPVGISAISSALVNESLAAVDGHYSATVTAKKVDGWILDAGQPQQRQVYEIFSPGSEEAKRFIATFKNACANYKTLTMLSSCDKLDNGWFSLILGLQTSNFNNCGANFVDKNMTFSLQDWMISNLPFNEDDIGVYIAGAFRETPILTIEFPDTVGESGTTPPVEPEMCDHTCDTRTLKDESEHTGTCTKCGATVFDYHHNNGTWGSDVTVHWRVCTDCNGQYSRENHAHNNTWEYDETSHWHKCTVCGAKFDISITHSFPEGSSKCSVCGYDNGTSGGDSNGEDSKEIPTTPSYVGGIVGKADGGSIHNCVVAGYAIQGSSAVGGIAGESTAEIFGCEANVKFAKCGDSASVGGIVGSGSAVRNCYALVHGIETPAPAALGGIAGKATVKVENCYVIFAGQTSGKPVADGTVSNCMYITDEGYYQGEDTTNGTGVLLADLNAKLSTPFAAAKATYTTSVTETSENYPYPAVFISGSNVEHYGPKTKATVSVKGDLTVGPIAGVYHLREYEYNFADEHSYKFDGYYSYNKDSVLFTAEYTKFPDESQHGLGNLSTRWYQGKDYIGVFIEKDYDILNSNIEVWVNEIKLDNAKLKNFKDVYPTSNILSSGSVRFADRNGIIDHFTQRGEGYGSKFEDDLFLRFDFYVLYYSSGEEVELGRDDVITIYNTPKDGIYAGKRGTLFTARGDSYSQHGYSFAGEVPPSGFDESNPPLVGAFIAKKECNPEVDNSKNKEEYYISAIWNKEMVPGHGRGWGNQDAKIGILIEKNKIDEIESGRLKIALDKVIVDVKPWGEVVDKRARIVNGENLDYSKYSLYVIVDEQNSKVTGNKSGKQNEYGADILLNGIVDQTFEITFVYGSKLYSNVNHLSGTTLTQSDVNNIFTDPEPLTPMVGLYSLYTSTTPNKYDIVGIRDDYTAKEFFENNKNIRSIPTNGNKTGTYGICFVQDPIQDIESGDISVTLTKKGTNVAITLDIIDNPFVFVNDNVDPAADGKAAYDYYIFSMPDGWEIENDDTITVKWKGKELMKCTALEICQNDSKEADKPAAKEIIDQFGILRIEYNYVSGEKFYAKGYYGDKVIGTIQADSQRPFFGLIVTTEISNEISKVTIEASSGEKFSLAACEIANIGEFESESVAYRVVDASNKSLSFRDWDKTGTTITVKFDGKVVKTFKIDGSEFK